MKSLLIVLIAGVLIASCDPSVVCTQEFRAVTVFNAGLPLTKTYTLDNTNGDTLAKYDIWTAETYVVVSDLEMNRIGTNQTRQFTFYGERNGNIVCQEVYTISTDMCHITKVSGADTLLCP